MCVISGQQEEDGFSLREPKFGLCVDGTAGLLFVADREIDKTATKDLRNWRVLVFSLPPFLLRPPPA